MNRVPVLSLNFFECSWSVHAANVTTFFRLQNIIAKNIYKSFWQNVWRNEKLFLPMCIETLKHYNNANQNIKNN